MSNPYKTLKFKKLQAKWAQKLKKSGFKDIEQGEKLLRHDGDWFHKHINQLKFESTRDFFLQCSVFLQSHDFQTKEHEHIWVLFSEGKTLDEIAKHVTLKRSQIHNVITRYIEIMQEN